MDKYLKNRGDVILFVVGALTMLLGGSALLYDIVSIIAGAFDDSNRDAPILVNSLAAMLLGAFCLWIVYLDRRRPGDPPRRPPQGPDRDSYLHPDHLPTGRRDAPDGTSD